MNFFADLSALGLGGVLYLGVVASCVVYLLIIYLIRLTGSVKQSLISFIVPVITALEGFFILNEGKEKPLYIQVIEYTGVLLVIASVYVVLKAPDVDEEDENAVALLDDTNKDMSIS